MGVDLPPVTSSDIQSELNKPQKTEVISIGECRENLDFQNQFDNLVSKSKNKTNDLKNELQEYTESQKEILRNIYCNLGDNNSELKKAIETQSVKIFEIPGRDLVALSINGKNVDYLYDLEGIEKANMIINLSEEFLPYYKAYIEGIGYNIKLIDGVLSFISDEGENINYKKNKFYDIILEVEDRKKILDNNLKDILKERGITY